jgi:DNA processing protein
LAELPVPPAQLFVIGSLPPPDQPVVAVVGSRRPSVEALRFARELARDLARNGVAIVSGGARGIDAAAHEGALLAGGCTVAVLAGDVTRPEPASNRALFRQICREGGAVVAEHARLPEHRGAFVTRNRLVAAWARAVVVVEARLRSGTRSTARVAAQLQRPVYAVPWSPFHAPGAGGLRLLEQGAKVLVRSDLLLKDLGLAVPPSAARSVSAELSDTAQRVLRALSLHQGASAEALVQTLGLQLPSLLRELAKLELEGIVELAGAGRYRVCVRCV